MRINKVEICGVDTSKLKTLSEERKRELLRLSKAGDKAAREVLRGDYRTPFPDENGKTTLPYGNHLYHGGQK